LEEIPGVGPKKATLLLKNFGSVKNIRNAQISDLIQVSGVDEKLAQVILSQLQGIDTTAINTATGEISEGA
jgi:excinuclease ABC subunit C